MSTPKDHYRTCCQRRTNLDHSSACPDVLASWRGFDQAVAEELSIPADVTMSTRGGYRVVIRRAGQATVGFDFAQHGQMTRAYNRLRRLDPIVLDAECDL